MKVMDISTVSRGYRVEVSDEMAESIQEALTKPDVRWIVIPSSRPGVELTYLNIKHVVSIELEK